MNLLKLTIFALSLFALASSTTKAQDWHCGDTLVDIRDGQKYPTVQIGNQCWIAKNMNIGVQVPTSGQQYNSVIEKTCYDNKAENCEVYGALYTWGEAVQYTVADKVQGVCPAKWHVATKTEWETLYQTVVTGQKLKVTKTDSPKWDGTNESRFSAIPAGLGYYDKFGRKGDWAVFWTATSVNPDYAWSVELDNYYQTLSGYSDLKMTNTYLTLNAFSIRCIKD